MCFYGLPTVVCMLMIRSVAPPKFSRPSKNSRPALNRFKTTLVITPLWPIKIKKTFWSHEFRQSPRRYLCQRSLNLSKIYPNDNMLAAIYPSVTNFIDIFPLSLKCSTEAWFSKLNFHPIFKMGSDFYLGANFFQICLHHAEWVCDE